MKPRITTHLFLPAFLVLFSACQGSTPELKLVKDENSYSIMAGEKSLMSYVYMETLPPDGVDPIYKRSAYIHPLNSPGGERLTRIQPPDHYHHYGIWNPWTRTSFGEYKVDFWNLASGEGTVRFAEMLERIEEGGRAGLRVRQEHVYYKTDGSEGIAMDEIWKVEVHDYQENSYLLDFTTTLRCNEVTGITLEAYRYGGGIGFRATEAWGPENATVLTSEGRDWEKADASHERWVIVEGASSVEQGRSGILFLSHPENYSHPEAIRMWEIDANGGKENVYFEFCPTRHGEWKLEPGIDYELKYRLVVFDGAISAEEAESYWQAFAQPE